MTVGTSWCSSCALELSGSSGLCPHHYASAYDGWAYENKVLCDFIHRGVEPPRLPLGEREEEIAGWVE